MNIDTESFIKYKHLNPITCKKLLCNKKWELCQKWKTALILKNQWISFIILPNEKSDDHFNRCGIGLLLFFTYIWIYVSFIKKKEKQAVAGVGYWVECQPVNQKITSLIPGQGTCLGCRPGPQLGCLWEATSWCFSPSLSLSLPLSLEMNK